MSELKAYTSVDIEEMDNAKLYCNGKLDCTRVYIKEEADKVIAEKDTKIIQLEALIENYNRISGEIIDNANHQKHKRCLAMAKWCRSHDVFTQLESERLGLPQRAIFMEYRRKAMWWNKWRNRWLKLAEKFKEAK